MRYRFELAQLQLLVIKPGNQLGTGNRELGRRLSLDVFAQLLHSFRWLASCD